MNDLIDLYSARLLALAADIPMTGRLAAPTGTATRRSPTCGSSITVDVVMKDGRVADFAQEVKACALGQAAASVLGSAVLGRTAAELAAGRDALASMLKGGPVPPTPFDGFEALRAAQPYPNRHASILLAISAAAEAAQ
ncbi:iron-sulfur cluster assembly scaffold protein [Cereibacter sp. SYSU M97828]|nr:iron-sulfur cluster assembly scaffold protein [Cereibacter flavus]